MFNHMERRAALDLADRMKFIEQFGFEFASEYLDSRMEAYKLGGEPAIPQFDRSWLAAAAGKQRENGPILGR
jgi:hypothetical protein